MCQLPVGQAGAKACTTRCDPKGAGGCAADHTCVLDWQGTRAWTDCRVAGSGGERTSCRDHSDCKRGLFCRGAPAGTCVRYCRSGANDCAHGATCRPLAPGDDVVVDGVAFGYCGAGD